jgi:sugar lactone lactonase YvrE
MGSIEYCAPEQIRGDEVDGRADVYSLGCVLFEAVAGRPPFKTDTEIATLYAHLEQEPPALSSVAPGSRAELDGVVTKALAKDPSGRYPTAGAFARDARQAVGVSSGERAVLGRPRRRRLAWIAGIVALAAIVVGVAIALSAGPDEGPPPAGATPRVRPAAVRLDPDTGAVEASIGGFSYRSAPTFLGDLAAGAGGVWLGVPPVVHHLDPATDTIRRSVTVGLTVGALAVGFRTVWVVVGDEVERIDPATDDLLRTVHLEDPQGIVGAGEIAVGRDAMWATTDRALYRIDPFTGRPTGSTEIAGSTGLAVADSTVWIVDDFSGTLTSFDESSGQVLEAVTIPGSLDGVVAGGGSVWVLDREAGVVSVVDPDGLTVVDTVRVGGDERDLVFGADAIWLADGSDRTVTRIEPASRQTTTFDVPGEAQYVTVDQESGEVWALSVPEA